MVKKIYQDLEPLFLREGVGNFKVVTLPRFEIREWDFGCGVQGGFGVQRRASTEAPLQDPEP